MRKYSVLGTSLSLIFMGVLLLVHCGPTKRKTVHLAEIDEAAKQYELEHFTDYVTNEETYHEWPELKLEAVTTICENYLGKLYPRTTFYNVQATIMKTNLYYKEMKDCSIAQIRLSVLECYNPSGPENSRNYFHFIRSPRLDCMYLLNRTRTSKMFIGSELCDSDTFYSLKEKKRLHEVLSSARKKPPASKKDSIKLLELHEENHLREYQFHKDAYVKWLDIKLNNERTREYCQIFLKKLYPRIVLPAELEVEFTTIKLNYMYIKNDTGLQYPPVDVAALNCILPTTTKATNFYQFIKAPNVGNSKCVYRVNRELISHLRRITKELCYQRNNCS